MVPATLGVLVFFILAADMASGQSLSANFADNVLRPVIGANNTLYLEGVYFNLLDFKNKALSGIVPQGNYANEFNVTDGTIAASSEMHLGKITLNNFPLMPGENIWQPINLTLFPKDFVMARTFVRTDPARAYAIVTLVELNMRKLRMSAVAGQKEPAGAEGRPGPGVIPADVQTGNGLVAAFNGGFQEKDGHYGMVVGKQTYLPLLISLATLVIDKNSNLKILNYMGQDLGANNLVIRQNGDMLVENGKVIPTFSDNHFSIWGRTTTRTMYTWRSGIGVTPEGNLIYAVGPSLIPETLGAALLAGGAVNAMQLDINPYWVRFVLFNPLGNGQYQHVSLQRNMYDGGKQFLAGYQKDFFYVYKR